MLLGGEIGVEVRDENRLELLTRQESTLIKLPHSPQSSCPPGCRATSSS